MTSLQKDELGFEHQSVSMPHVPDPEIVSILFIFTLGHIMRVSLHTNAKLSVAAPIHGRVAREASY